MSDDLIERLRAHKQFRIIPDPNNPKLWAYEPLAHDQMLETKGGFRTAKDAHRAVLMAEMQKDQQQ